MCWRSSTVEGAAKPFVAGIDAFALSVLVLGLMVRIATYLQQRALWYDEAMLSLNILTRSIWELTAPLAYNQAAPIGFLWGARVVTSMIGPSELALRAIPLACGIGTTILAWLVARRMLGSGPALIAAVLVAASGPLVQYSVQVKQYATDAFVTVSLVGLAIRVLDRPEANGPWWQLIVGGAIGLFISQPSVFVLASIGAALLADRRMRMAAGWHRLWLAAAGTWVVVFAGLYFASYRRTATSDAMIRVWGGTFLTLGAPDFVLRAWRAADAALAAPLSPMLAFMPLKVLVVLFLLGIGRVAVMGGPGRAVLLVGPYLALGLAAVLGKYPVATRLFLFAAPLALLAVVAGATLVVDLVPSRWRMLAYGAIAGILLAGNVRKLADWRSTGISIEESRDLIAEVNGRRDSEPVYVFTGGIPAWAVYTTDWNAPDTDRLARLERSAFRVPSHASAEASAALSPCDASRREVIGLPTGSAWDESRGWATGGPPTGWGDGEVHRLRMAASPYVWIFVAHYQEAVLEVLLDEVVREGGVIKFRNTAKGAAIYRVQFPPSVTVVPPWACVN